MTVQTKVKMLLISCLLMVTLLCWIQYRLVRNTYNLNTKSYLAEVTQKMTAIDQPFVDSANHRAMQALTRHVPWYIHNKNRVAFLDSISHIVSPTNSGDYQRLTTLLDSALGSPPVKFTMQYSSIVLAIDGTIDTLLKKSEPPFVILGEPVSEDQLNVGEGIQTNNFTGKDLGSTDPQQTYRLTVSYSKKADASDWQRQVVKRMTSTFLLAVVLILGIVILFYVLFRTLLHQKKVADIQTDLTNNITHELKTPLSSLSIIIKTLRKVSIREQPSLYNELLISLERQQSKLSHIVDRVLESAWATDVPLRMKQHEMNSLMRQIATDFPMETHSLVLDIPQDAVLIDTDEYLLTSSIHNMLDNAVKYSKPGTPVEVKTYVKKDQYVIAIKDYGKGINGSEQSKIFGKFYRVSERNLHSVKGIGLGLYLCKVKMKRLNGSLSVESEPMKGSTFKIYLPLV